MAVAADRRVLTEVVIDQSVQLTDDDGASPTTLRT